MQRTFTLQRLFINLTAFAALLGVVVAFPRISAWCFMHAALLFPALGICLCVAYFADFPRKTFGIALLGTFVGLILSPRILASWDEPPSWWDLYLLNFQTLILSTTLGASLFGVAARMILRRRGRSQPNGSTSTLTASDP